MAKELGKNIDVNLLNEDNDDLIYALLRGKVRKGDYDTYNNLKDRYRNEIFDYLVYFNAKIAAEKSIPTMNDEEFTDFVNRFYNELRSYYYEYYYYKSVVHEKYRRQLPDITTYNYFKRLIQITNSDIYFPYPEMVDNFISSHMQTDFRTNYKIPFAEIIGYKYNENRLLWKKIIEVAFKEMYSQRTPGYVGKIKNIFDELLKTDIDDKEKKEVSNNIRRLIRDDMNSGRPTKYAPIFDEYVEILNAN